MALNVRTTLIFSTEVLTHLRRRTPAVSIMRYSAVVPSARLRVMGVSIESRVVPGMSDTIMRSTPRRRLSNVLLPTLGRPTIATRMGPSSSPSSSGTSGGSASSTASIRSSVPPECCAETGNSGWMPSS